jgi:ubiquinone/menaquinone biosynthesis C-methylase UbiE
MNENSYELTYNHESRYWWFTARTEIFKKIFKNFKDIGWISDNPIMLNLGCGTGIQTEVFSEFGEVVSLDFSEEALGFCGKRNLSGLIRADAEKLPFQESSFDIVLCFDILEHLESDVAAISEMNRILKPGGIAFISIPAYKFLWSSFDDVNWHKRRYRKKEISSKVSGSGMSVVKAGYFNFFLFPLALVRRIYEKIFKRNEQVYYLPKAGNVTNSIFKTIFSFERFFLPRPSFPFGVSIICIARKS